MHDRHPDYNNYYPINAVVDEQLLQVHEIGEIFILVVMNK